MRSLRACCALVAALGFAGNFWGANPSAEAGVIRLDKSEGTFGALLDDLTSSDLGTPTAGPLAIPGLLTTCGKPVALRVIGLSSGGVLNATSRSLGINSPGADKTDLLEQALGESFSIQFDHDVLLHAIDFRGFDSGEQFRFGPARFEYDQLDNKSTDVLTLPTPLSLYAGQRIDVLTSRGDIGLQSLDLSFVAPRVATVPEPASFFSVAMMMVGGAIAKRRQRQR